jgi:hypothetical protein
LNVPFNDPAFVAPAHWAHHQQVRSNYPTPDGLDFVFCQQKACALHKKL